MLFNDALLADYLKQWEKSIIEKDEYNFAWHSGGLYVMNALPLKLPEGADKEWIKEVVTKNHKQAFAKKKED